MIRLFDFTIMQKISCFKKTAKLIPVALLLFSSCTKEVIVQPEPPEPSVNMDVLADASSLSLASAPSSKLAGSILKVGINGHLGDLPYLATPWAKQIQMLKDRGMSYYRINVQTKSDGSASSSSDFAELQSAASAAGIKLLPMLYLRTLSFSKTEKENYSLGKTLGANFAAKYGKYLTFYNLGNDLELPLLYSNKTGEIPEHYNSVKFKLTAAYLKGMDEGIKSKDADAKTIINAGWLHYGFLKMCESYGVKFDRVGYNWYSDMEGAAAKAPYYIDDITKKLSSLFPNKPIWFTEFNYRFKALSLTNETDQNAFVTKFIAKCKANSHVKVALIYELFDEPYKSVQESKYGIIKWKIFYSSWLDKTISKTLLLNSSAN